jgi:hypothetical protein
MFEAVPGSISIERDTSLYTRPKRSNGASILPPSKPSEFPRAVLKIDKTSLKEVAEWNLAGK